MRAFRSYLSRISAFLAMVVVCIGFAVHSPAIQAQTVDRSIQLLFLYDRSATVGFPYTRTLQATGGTGPYTFQASGDLPPSFSLSPSGMLTGTPTAAVNNVLSFYITIQDSLGHTNTAQVAIWVNAVPLSLTSVPPAIQANQPFTSKVTASGGTPPYDFFITGCVVSGVTLTSDGTLTGQINYPGTYPCRVHVQDSSQNVNQDYVPYSLVVQGEQQPTINANAGFSPALGLHLNGPVTFDYNYLNLMSSQPFQAASAWSNAPVDITKFSTDFDYSFRDATAPYYKLADGFTFTFQNSDPTALGTPGGDLGYTGIPKSVAIKFDLFDNVGEQANTVGYFSNGQAPLFPSTISNIGLASTNENYPLSAHITYNGVSLTLTLTGQNGSSYTYSRVIDLPKVIGSKTAYVGFTAGSGQSTSTVQIHTWTYQNF